MMENSRFIVGKGLIDPNLLRVGIPAALFVGRCTDLEVSVISSVQEIRAIQDGLLLLGENGLLQLFILIFKIFQTVGKGLLSD